MLQYHFHDLKNHVCMKKKKQHEICANHINHINTTILRFTYITIYISPTHYLQPEMKPITRKKNNNPSTTENTTKKLFVKYSLDLVWYHWIEMRWLKMRWTFGIYNMKVPTCERMVNIYEKKKLKNNMHEIQVFFVAVTVLMMMLLLRLLDARYMCMS